MSPSPARKKPPPSHPASLMNPTPDPPDEDDHMIIPEIYESEPGFLTQTQSNNPSNILTTILQKIENLEKREANITLPTGLTTLITRLNDRIDELAEKQSKMDKVINDLLTKINDGNKHRQLTNNLVSFPSPNSPPSARTPLSFAAAAANTQHRIEPTLPKRPPPEICQQQTQESNKFKKFDIVIQTKFGAPKPCKRTSPQEACNKINKALMDVNANCNNTPVRIKAFTRYPSGDIKSYTKSRMEARWLLENRLAWTHRADPLFVTKSLLQQNDIRKEDVDRIRWLGHPKEEEKSHGSLVIYSTNKPLAHQILRGGLIFDGNFMQTMAYTSGPPQCFNCLKTAHQTFQCKGNPTCTKCGETHQSQDCKDLSYTPSIKRCVQCVNQDKSTNQHVDLYNKKYRHSALSQKCPIRQREIQDLTPQPRINGKTNLHCLASTGTVGKPPQLAPPNTPKLSQNHPYTQPKKKRRETTNLHLHQQADTISLNHQPPTRKQLTDHNNTTGCIQLNPLTHSTVLIQSTYHFLSNQHPKSVVTDRGHLTNTNAAHNGF
ncbi:hypothetical protein O181_036283 [Austropuccinia psidii MF-1]|uniref:Nucleic-acid-binding protein from transposon X-element n=1 Tax=Austropuccinia psidii MF-1 TaxID=1389203 RepID=A0A9Q3H925_9BASI|nr:hypothetical protein [Austropuccinia psidii MF-1]